MIHTQEWMNVGEWSVRACVIVYNQSLTERYGAAGKLMKVANVCCRSVSVCALALVSPVLRSGIVERWSIFVILVFFVVFFFVNSFRCLLLRSHSEWSYPYAVWAARWRWEPTGTHTIQPCRMPCARLRKRK